MRKGFTQMDYVVAVGIFVIVFALVTQIVSNFFSDLTQNTNIRLMTSEASDLLSVAEQGPSPSNWNGTENVLRGIGLATTSYRLNVRVNNTAQYWIDQSKPVVTIPDERVVVNFTQRGIGVDLGSVAVYDDNGNPVAYEIGGNLVNQIIFRVNIPAGATKNYTVYFDDDSNFTAISSAQAGFDNLSEIVSQVEKIDVIQYRKVIYLNSSNYSLVKNITGIPRDFRITIIDSATGGTFLQYGGILPQGGNIVALRRFVVFQNSTAGIRRGYMNVQVW